MLNEVKHLNAVHHDSFEMFRFAQHDNEVQCHAERSEASPSDIQRIHGTSGASLNMTMKCNVMLNEAPLAQRHTLRFSWRCFASLNMTMNCSVTFFTERYIINQNHQGALNAQSS